MTSTRNRPEMTARMTGEITMGSEPGRLPGAVSSPWPVYFERHRSVRGGGLLPWRGPVWFPVNYLIIESLQTFHYFFGDDLKVECPTGSGQMMNLWNTAAALSRRLTHIFLRAPDGHRPVYGGIEKFQDDPYWRDCVLFYEYFHGDNGAGIGASHQTGWTDLVAKLPQQSGE
jgi:hypothetical protein